MTMCCAHVSVINTPRHRQHACHPTPQPHPCLQKPPTHTAVDRSHPYFTHIIHPVTAPHLRAIRCCGRALARRGLQRIPQSVMDTPISHTLRPVTAPHLRAIRRRGRALACRGLQRKRQAVGSGRAEVNDSDGDVVRQALLLNGLGAGMREGGTLLRGGPSAKHGRGWVFVGRQLQCGKGRGWDIC